MSAVRIDGLPELKRNLQRLTDKMQKKVLADATKAAATVVHRAAKANGNAISSNIGKVVNRKKLRSRHKYEAAYSVNLLPKRPPLVEREINTDTEWGKALARGGYALIAAFFEYGTSKMSSRPLLGAAFESNKAVADAILRQKIVEGMEKAANKEGVRL